MTKLAVVGATGLVGTKMLETLNRKNIPFDELVLFSSARSAGQEVEFQEKTYTVQELTDARASEHFDYVLMAYTTYQAVSGSGMKGKKDLAEGVNGKAPEAYPHPIYNNVLPHIDVFLENGYTKEEQKMIDETRKILNAPDLKVTATCARVPVQDSHSVEIDVTLDKEATAEDIKALFDQDDRVVLVDNPENNEYPMAINSTNKDEVFVGRIRRDDSLENTFHVWCTSDNLLKGAALNAVQVLEQVMRLKGAN